ncbi:flagellar basal body rod protein FlgB [Herbaspirillum huttiense]|uniref:flagellar basal body rod protein FlgB n=1 Tax=Herbaspirillum huttiense TaxID=863372 RepID=UPI000687F8E8|nr:flagellar basal body rod protein FlgB [Herbaspirillum huttiense]
MNVIGTNSLPNDGGEKDEKFWKNAVRLVEKRLGLLVSNIANADTPNYKARDIAFTSALRQAMTNSKLPVFSKGTATVSNDSPLEALILYRSPTQPSADGNTVDLDQESATFSHEAIRYQFFLDKAVGEYNEIGDLYKKMVG